MERLLVSLPSPRACSDSGLGTFGTSVPGIAESFQYNSHERAALSCISSDTSLLPSDIGTTVSNVGPLEQNVNKSQCGNDSLLYDSTILLQRTVLYSGPRSHLSG